MRPGPAEGRGLANLMKIQVIRAFYLAGDVQPVDTVLDVDSRLGAELVHNHKAVRLVEASAEAAQDTKPAAKAAAKEKAK